MKSNINKIESIIEAREYAEGIVETVREPLLVLDAKLKVISANKAFYQTFKVSPCQTEGRLIYDLGNRQWNIPKLRRLLMDIISKSSFFDNYEIEHNFERIGQKTMLLNARRIPRLPAKPRILLLAIEDITKIRKTEREKTESEIRYISLYLTSRDAIMTIEPPSWKFTSGNPATLRLFKAKNEAQFVACEPWKLSPRYQPDGQLSTKKAKQMINIAMRRGSNFFEWVHRQLNGKEFFCNVLLSKITIGKNSFLHATVRDITQLKKTELALRESEERFRSIFDRAAEGILLAEVGSKKFYIGNKEICKMLGYRPEEITKLGVNDIHPKKDLQYVLSQFKRQARGDFRLAKDLPILRKDGSVFYADVNATTIKIAGKLYLMGFFHDNTEHRKLEEAMEEIRTAKDKIILESIGQGVVACDEKGKIILFNSQAAILTGFSIKEAIGKHYRKVFNFVEEKTNKQSKDDIGQTIEKRKAMSMVNHKMIIKKDRTRIPIGESVAPIIDKHGKIKGCVIILRDVSKEREIDRAKSEFVSLASHQLRTPITSINWTTEMFLNGDFGELTPEQKKGIKMLADSSHRMASLVGSLLNISRIELGTFSVEPKLISIDLVINEILKELAVMAKNKKLNFVKRFGHFPKINVDPILLRIILQNIITNAVIYSFPGKTVRISIKKSKKDLLIDVANQGIGIPAKEQKKIFSKLYRASNAQKSNSTGTGLGLYIVKSILDHTGGKISFTSIQGGKTVFRIALPLTGMSVRAGKKNLEYQINK